MDAERFSAIVETLPVRVAGDAMRLGTVLGVTAWTVGNYQGGKTIPAPVARLMEILFWANQQGKLDAVLGCMGVKL